MYSTNDVMHENTWGIKVTLQPTDLDQYPLNIFYIDLWHGFINWKKKSPACSLPAQDISNIKNDGPLRLG